MLTNTPPDTSYGHRTLTTKWAEMGRAGQESGRRSDWVETKTGCAYHPPPGGLRGLAQNSVLSRSRWRVWGCTAMVGQTKEFPGKGSAFAAISEKLTLGASQGLWGSPGQTWGWGSSHLGLDQFPAVQSHWHMWKTNKQGNCRVGQMLESINMSQKPFRFKFQGWFLKPVLLGLQLKSQGGVQSCRQSCWLHLLLEICCLLLGRRWLQLETSGHLMA